MVDTSYENALNIIYIAEHKETKRQYVGQTVVGLKERKRTHLKDARRQKPSMYFTRALAKHGADAFTWSVVWTATDEEVQEDVLDDLEELTIAVNNTLVPNGYNVSPGRQGRGRTTGHSNKRHPHGQKLPDNIYLISGGYRGVDRKTGKVRCFTDKRCTMDQKLRVVKDWMEKANTIGLPPRHKKRQRDEDDELPAYLQHAERVHHGRTYEGYTVRHPKLPIKQFWKSRQTMEQKLAAAKAYLDTAPQ